MRKMCMVLHKLCIAVQPFFVNCEIFCTENDEFFFVWCVDILVKYPPTNLIRIIKTNNLTAMEHFRFRVATITLSFNRFQRKIIPV